MKRIIVTSAVLLVICLCIQSVPAEPVLSWQKCLGGSAGEEWGYSVDKTSEGGYILTGVAYSSDGDVTENKGLSDLWVVKTDSSGEIEWQKAYGGSDYDYGLSVSETLDTGYIIVGTTRSNDGDLTDNHGGTDVWVIHLNKEGDIIWQKTFGGSLVDEGGMGLQTTDGSYIITGYSHSNDGDVSGNHGAGDAWVARLSASGDIIWQRCIGGADRDTGTSVIQTADGGFLVIGSTYSSDGDLLGNHGNSDVLAVKLDENGNIVWQKTFGGTQLDWGHDALETSSGNILISGVTVSNDQDVSGNHGNSDIWIVMVSQSGELIWQKCIGGSFSDTAWSSCKTENNEFVIVGDSYSMDGEITGNHGYGDILAIKVDKNGEMLWQKCLGGTGYDSASWVTIDKNSDIVLTGCTQSEDGDVSDNHGKTDLWLACMSESAQEKQVTAPVDLNLALVAFPGFESVPQDTDGDGKYEDINGNGRADYSDAKIFFDNLEWVAENEPVSAFDFNGNGKIDYHDLTVITSEV